MRILSAKDYAAETGYPMVTLCRLIRQGIIPHEKRGAGYLIDADMVDEIIAERMNANLKRTQPIHFQPKTIQRGISSQNNSNSFLKALRTI